MRAVKKSIQNLGNTGDWWNTGGRVHQHQAKYDRALLSELEAKHAYNVSIIKSYTGMPETLTSGESERLIRRGMAKTGKDWVERWCSGCRQVFKKYGNRFVCDKCRSKE